MSKKLTKKFKVQLLREVLVAFTNDRHNTRRGICYHIWSLESNHSAIITNRIHLWFESQKPSEKLHSDFYKNPSYYGGMWWWFMHDEGRDQRIAFLNHLIETLT